MQITDIKTSLKMNRKNYHMSPERFREEGKKIIDWIVDYYENIEKYPVFSQVEPGEIKEKIPEIPLQTGESMEVIM